MASIPILGNIDDLTHQVETTGQVTQGTRNTFNFLKKNLQNLTADKAGVLKPIFQAAFSSLEAAIEKVDQKEEKKLVPLGPPPAYAPSTPDQLRQRFLHAARSGDLGNVNFLLQNENIPTDVRREALAAATEALPTARQRVTDTRDALAAAQQRVTDMENVREILDRSVKWPLFDKIALAIISFIVFCNILARLLPPSPR